jgi:hypothetical protein
MNRSFQLDYQRLYSRPTLEMVEAVKEAKREKIRNKTKEYERARRGQWNSRILKRMRQGPPAHIMSKMSARNALRDKIIRSPSEVGHVAKMKRSMGMKLKHAPPWDPEAGDPDLQIELNRLDNYLRKINLNKRA